MRNRKVNIYFDGQGVIANTIELRVVASNNTELETIQTLKSILSKLGFESSYELLPNEQFTKKIGREYGRQALQHKRDSKRH